ncbi:transcription factor IIF subunit tfg1 [Vanrija albida]|uniref:Transcription initiation factor IIF subunit alpha n=1 Tax=Vanrija albida TaxID=181172 RepID=A0ABR3PRT5_9TREE
MVDPAFFLKKKTRPGAPRAPKPAATAGPSGARRPPPPRPAGPRPGGPPGGPSKTEAAVKAEVKDESQLTAIQIYSAEPGSGLRYNFMRLNSNRDIDPSTIPAPILMNRKQPGPKQPPQFATDEDGKIIGRYVYDDQGKPVLDEDGKPVVEKRNEMDMSLVGTAPGQSNKRRGKRNIKEVFHQDVEVIKLRREEAQPWVLEAKNPSSDKPAVPEHWVGRMRDGLTLPTVLLVNDGQNASFTMVPLGREYQFEPERPFKIMDADQANKYYEMQTKYKAHNRWGLRQEGSSTSGPSTPAPVKDEDMRRLENRAQRLEWNIMNKKGTLPSAPVKRERFDDDYVRERRNIGRGLEGTADEELDFDVNEEFQDDEDSNTFYHNKEEDDEKKLQEERQKQEYRWANANVGDRPQIDGDDDADDDLFDDKLTSEGKRLRKMMRKRAHGEEEDLYESTDESDDDSDSDAEKDKEKEKEKDKSERPGSRSGSRPPGERERSTGSPSRRLQPPTPDRSGSVPSGSGAAYLAKRAASRGVSPRRSRAGSPLARGSSPDGGRSGSPLPNGRANSPGVSSSLARGGSPAPPQAAREGTPSASGLPRPKSKSAKRKATSESPLRDTPTGTPGSSAPSKRKSSEDGPSPGTPGERAGSSEPKKKKNRGGSSTPVPEMVPFPGMILGEAVLQWLLAQEDQSNIPMGKAISAFAKQIQSSGDKAKDNQRLFLRHIKQYTENTGSKTLRIKPEFLP